MPLSRLVALALALSCVPLAAAAGDCDPVFADVIRYGLPEAPASVVTLDFNRDGRPDIAAIGEKSRTLSLLLNRGHDLVHAPAVTLSHPASFLLTASDGAIIALGAEGISRVTPARVTATTISVDAPVVATTGDFNGDTIPDLAFTTLRGSSSTAVRLLRVYLGSADGTFAASGTPATLSNVVYDAEVGDLNADGKLDIVLGDSANGRVFDGNGDGTFKPFRRLFPPPQTASYIALGDFDRDGRVDVITGSSLFLGADPNARRILPLSSGAYPVDLDGDGILDIFSFQEILRGNGDGTFTVMAAMKAAAPGGSRGVLFADFDGDSRIDEAHGSVWADVAIHRGTGAFTFEGTENLFGLGRLFDTAVGDMNGDGLLDVALGSLSNVVVYLANPDGSFSYKSRIQAGTSTLVAGDFTGDGKLDLFLDGVIAPGNGEGTFEQVSHSAFSNPITAIAADVNGDGRLDKVTGYASPTSTSIGTVRFAIADGAGGFTTMETKNLPSVYALAAADFDRDGTAEVIAATSRQHDPGDLYLIDPASPQTPVHIASGVEDESVAAGDVDGDGNPDIVTLTKPADEVLIFGGNGNGTFRAPRRINVPDGPNGGVAVGDFNGDGRLDIAVAVIDRWEILILMQQNDGSFVESWHIPPATWNGITAADFDADGKDDLLVDDRFFGEDAFVAFSRCRAELPLTSPPIRLTSNERTVEGDSATLIADLDHSVTGTVTFFDWGIVALGRRDLIPLGSATIANGRAVLTTTSLAKGVHEIHAVYNGDGQLMRSRSATIEHTVTAASGKRRRSIHH